MGKLNVFFVVLLLGILAVTLAQVCKNHNKWCHYMTTHGACSYHNKTRTTCPRTCRLCTVNCPDIKPSDRQDCGYIGITYEECWHAGCCWKPIGINSKSPWCYKPPV